MSAVGIRGPWVSFPSCVNADARLAGTDLFAWGVEVSQLYHAPWIDAIRAMVPGRLVLGTTFNWPDLPAYSVGIALGSLAEWRWRA